MSVPGRHIERLVTPVLPNPYDVPPVLGAVSRGNEAIEGTSDDVAHGAREHLLGGAIEEHDPLLLVHRDDGVHCRGDDSREARLAAPQRDLFLAALGEIASHLRESHEGALLVAQRRDDHVRPESSSIFPDRQPSSSKRPVATATFSSSAGFSRSSGG